MERAPDKCPKCGSSKMWHRIRSSEKKFSAGKAYVGSVLLGPVGLAAGKVIGKKVDTYLCGKCGFEGEYKAED